MPGNSRFSAEQVSRTAYNSSPEALGDYVASAHLQGEVFGTMLDLMIRDATDGKRSMDNVMRLLHERTGGPTGMTSADIEAAVASVCACVAKPFFDAYVRGAQPLNYNRYLGLIGLKADVKWDTARSQNGNRSPDHRLWAYSPPGDSLLALAVNNPETIWGKAGLHTGERVVSLQGNSVRTWNEFRRELSSSRIGDPVHLVVKPRGALPARTVTVIVDGFTRPVVTITEISGATEKQTRLREAWLAGTP
jgi:predicted metalloprotease with PDZ domain